MAEIIVIHYHLGLINAIFSLDSHSQPHSYVHYMRLINTLFDAACNFISYLIIKVVLKSFYRHFRNDLGNFSKILKSETKNWVKIRNPKPLEGDGWGLFSEFSGGGLGGDKFSKKPGGGQGGDSEHPGGG